VGQILFIFALHNMEIDNIYQKFITQGKQISTDTRKITPSAIFFALKGENFNGNLFVDKALELGAAFVITDEVKSTDERVILVEDVLKTMQTLARYHRQKCKATVIGIAGSNGKTTTKELLVSVLKQKYKTHFTKGNFNNHIGLPLTLLELDETDEVSIVELGTNREGDIKELCEIALPDMGLITNIGKEHLQGFGSIEGVAKAESELFDDLKRRNKLAFVNTDDVWLKAMGEKLEKKREYHSNMPQMKLKALSPKIVFEYNGTEIQSALMGKHNYQNIASCVAIAEELKLNESEIKAGVEAYVPSNNRSQMIQSEKGNLILLDAYNANPSSVEAAIGVLETMPSPRLAIIGDMFELGAHEAQEHQAIRDLIEKSEVEEVVLVGEAFAKTSGKETTRVEKEKVLALEDLKNRELKNRSVLIKGSRGMKMEDFLKEL
jgi:UDP-N-acetylmuramoyl-tripeptide--D-alanyl-D-alanine ligase